MDKTVLIIEDDRDIQDYYQVVLGDLGINILQAENGLEGLNAIDSGEKIDLIILDIVMPVMDGEEFLRELRLNRKSELPVILSSVDDVSASRLEKVAKVQGSFFKLARVDELRSMIRNYLTQ